MAMRFVRLLAFVAAALCFIPFAHADGSPVNMVFTGVNGANDGVYYVSPYTGTMNGQTVVLFCDDIKNDVYIGETWTANVTNLGTALSSLNGFSSTRYGGVSTSPVFANGGVAYQEAAWLTSQFASHPNDFVSLQYALWDIMNPGSEPTSYGNVAWWLNQAAGNYSSINAKDFSVVTNTGKLALTGQVQEFIVHTPEPGSLALLLCGLFALAAFRIHRSRVIA
jgi:hypothetical protein